MYNANSRELGNIAQMPTIWQPKFSEAIWWSFASSVAAGVFVYYLLEARR